MKKTNLKLKADRILKAEHISSWLGYSMQTVYNKVYKKEIPFIRLGGKTLRFKQNEIEEWINGKKD